MGELARIGVAIDEELLKKFDERNQRCGYANRSEAFRDLIRDALIQERAEEPDAEVVGTLTLVSRPSRADAAGAADRDAARPLPRDHLDAARAPGPRPLPRVLVLRGRSASVRRIADRLIATKGVQHGRLTLTSAGA